MQQEKQEEQSLALLEKNTVGIVGEQIKQYQERKELFLPSNYSPENALKSAFLILQETRDRNNAPVLQACTKNTIANALFDMCVQGLNPAKKQCYFIAYGKRLTCMRSYFGSMAVVKNIAGAKEVYAEIIYSGDEFSYGIKNGNKTIKEHIQKFTNIDSEKIAGAYCTIVFGDDEESTEIMSIEQIKKAWKKSKTNPEREGSVHEEFAEEMCRRTVINRACKRFINSSSDSALLLEAINRGDEISAEEDVKEITEKEANKEVIDIHPTKEKEKEGDPQGKEKTGEEKSGRKTGRQDTFEGKGQPKKDPGF